MKTKTIKGDLVLKKDFKFDGNLKVEGNIRCEGGRWNINTWSIDAWNIYAGDINARDIHAEDINARDIHAENILCEKVVVKKKLIARLLVQNRSKLKWKEWKIENMSLERLKNQMRIHWHWIRQKEDYEEAYKMLECFFNQDEKAGVI